MLRDLRQVCERPGQAEPADFRAAAATLLRRQFLLLERTGDRDAYRLVVNHFDYFSNLFDALGWTLHRDDTFGLVGLLPGEAEGYRHLRLVDSLMLLCLRLLYEEGMERFAAREGCVFAQAEDLLSRYETLLKRKRPLLGDFREMLRRLRRYSLIELQEETVEELPVIRILPTIRLVTGDQVQGRIAAFTDSQAERDEGGEEGDRAAASLYEPDVERPHVLVASLDDRAAASLDGPDPPTPGQSRRHWPGPDDAEPASDPASSAPAPRKPVLTGRERAP